MYEMMCGRLPFYSRDHKQLFEMILTVRREWTGEEVKGVGSSKCNARAKKSMLCH